jgi:membrane fusion protein, macrolide-specific efflux system
MTRKATQWWGVGAGVALLALGAWWLLHKPAATPRVTVRVTRGDIEKSVLAGGTISPLKIVSIGAQASGRILALHVALGDQVKKGDLIAEIDPSTEKNALATAQAALDQARAQRDSRQLALHQLDLAFQRAKVTYPAEASSQADYEAAEAAYKGAQQDVQALNAAVRSAQVNVDTARVTLGFTKVVAPMDGTVVAIVAPEGQTVNAVQSAPTIVKLADLSTMTVKAQVSEADIGSVKPGQSVYFTTLGNPGKHYVGTLRALEPAPESIAAETTAAAAASASASSSASSAVYYNALFDVPNAEHALRPSMTAEVHILLQQAKNVLTIRVGALGPQRTDGAYEVRVVERDGRTRVEKVRIGIQSSTSAEVLEGLTEGDEVVVGDETLAKSPQKPPGFL